MKAFGTMSDSNMASAAARGVVLRHTKSAYWGIAWVFLSYQMVIDELFV